ncbi:MAG: diguanylate cyclase [Acidobacteriota bacterium]
MSEQITPDTIEPKAEAQSQSSLAAWLRLQRSLAEKNGIALTTLSRDGAVVGRIENDNSVCQSMRVSAEHSRLCFADCAKAYSNAVAEGRPIEFRCHAGLHCFAAPIKVDKQNLVVLGGRAFTSTAEYSQFLSRYNDLAAVATGEGLRNVKFLDSRELRDAGQLVISAAESHFQISNHSVELDEQTEASPGLMDAHLEIIRLSDQLESKNRAIAHFFEFLRSIASSLDSQTVYVAVMEKLCEIMKSERSSLMIFDDKADELVLEAAVGADFQSAGVRLHLGEGVAGAVMASGIPLIVRHADTDARVPQSGRHSYKTKSFISFPITLGTRKVGVVNLTDRMDGSPFTSDDLSLVEIMAPHLALIVERTEWHRKAEAYQRMSLTDPLTSLPNRRYLEERLFEEVERSKRYGTPLSFMLIDVDHFKRYNDLYGHTNADAVLVRAAQLLRRCVRSIDMAARFAGDEFCIVLPETDLADAERIAERVRENVARMEMLSDDGSVMGQVTFSIGVSSFSPSRQNPLAIIETADRALYKAKTMGRNCVVVYEEAAVARHRSMD